MLTHWIEGRRQLSMDLGRDQPIRRLIGDGPTEDGSRGIVGDVTIRGMRDFLIRDLTISGRFEATDCPRLRLENVTFLGGPARLDGCYSSVLFNVRVVNCDADGLVVDRSHNCLAVMLSLASNRRGATVIDSNAFRVIGFDVQANTEYGLLIQDSQQPLLLGEYTESQGSHRPGVVLRGTRRIVGHPVVIAPAGYYRLQDHVHYLTTIGGVFRGLAKVAVRIGRSFWSTGSTEIRRETAEK